MRELLLVSTSTTFGTGYLEHCGPQIQDLFGSAGTRRVLFVPYALCDRDDYARKARSAFSTMGFELESIHESAQPVDAVLNADGIFIGGGNTFRLLKTLHDQGLIEPIRQRVLDGMPYAGTSAGSNVACPTIMTTNDMPIVFPPSFDALNLVPFQINAHYLDPDPDSTHMGETRDTRLREYHEENSLPVVALREGAMLIVDGDQVTMGGQRGGRLFLRDEFTINLKLGARIDTLLPLA